MYLNDKEEKVIDIFYGNIDEFARYEMILIWESGVIKAYFDTCFEDMNDYDEDDERFEEYVSFAFEVINVSGEPPVFITKDNFFCVNYHNFPDAIMVEGKKIN